MSDTDTRPAIVKAEDALLRAIRTNATPERGIWQNARTWATEALDGCDLVTNEDVQRRAHSVLCRVARIIGEPE